jgi:hypothetical protein
MPTPFPAGFPGTAQRGACMPRATRCGPLDVIDAEAKGLSMPDGCLPGGGPVGSDRDCAGVPRAVSRTRQCQIPAARATDAKL